MLIGDDVRGVAGSAVTGKLYVGYRDTSGSGMLYCLEIYEATVLWNRKVPPGVDRLASNPDGQLLYVPTWEGETADYIQASMRSPATWSEECTSPADRMTRNTLGRPGVSDDQGR